jgi:hypothetical protein
MGGGKVEAATKSTMILDGHAPPFIPGGVVTDTRPLGVMGGRCLGTGATQALVAAAALTDAALPSAPTRTRSRPPSLDERLARLGIGTSRTRSREFTVVDLPL